MRQKIVIKLGGSVLNDLSTLKELSRLIQAFRDRNRDVVLVHGGGPAINLELTRRDIQWKFISGQRQTTPAMMDVIDEVLGKTVNQVVVTSLNAENIPAVGLSGADDKILLCTQASRQLQRVGKVESVNTAPILKALESGVPAIAPIGYGIRGGKFNVNADWAATKIAMALRAEELIFLTDQTGILDQNKKLIEAATPETLEEMIESGVIFGGMLTKVKAMVTALDAGIQKVRVLHASKAGQLLATNKLGTLLKGRVYENTSGF